MADPLVSVCVPTFNRPQYLAASLRSICAQSYDRLEILISDNASTDGETERIGREFAAKDPRVRYVRHPKNLGLYPNHNYCIEASRGELLCLFHDDDEYGPEIVARYVEFMNAHPAAGVVCSDWALIDEASAVVGQRAFAVPAVRHGYDYIEQTVRTGRSSVALSGAMLRRDALAGIRFADDGFLGFEDFVVWFSLAERADVGHLRLPLWRYRLHRGSLSRGTILKMSENYRHVLFRYCDDHLRRHPDRGALVAGWRSRIDQYLFWALFYETARHYRGGGGAPRVDVSIFDFYEYALSADELRAAHAALGRYRTGLVQHAAYAFLTLAQRTGCTAPVGWLTRYSAGLRALLRLA
ncbi:MAG: glycosyltransferase family 2 protein [Candidatus Rokubacteria bacterium]|nr:glycosyltransferase family 2 protein [Candidatus Rokubacteria bacterium]